MWLPSCATSESYARRARHDQQAARLAVEPVDDARAEPVADPGELGEPFEQSRHEGAVLVPRAGMHHEPGRLRHDDHVVVGVADDDLDGLGAGRRVGHRRPQQLDDLAGFEPAALGHRLAADEHVARDEEVCTSARLQPVSSATARSTRSPASSSGTTIISPGRIRMRFTARSRLVPRVAAAPIGHAVSPVLVVASETFGGNRPRRMMRNAPTVTHESARLNTGHQPTWTKSTT